MTEFDNLKKLAMKLARAESENKVKTILEQHGVWEYDDDHWQNYSDDPTNWSNVGNQQGRAFDALAEKITNSIDTKLLRAVKADGIDPESGAAPQSMKEAVKQYFDVPDGDPANLSPQARSDLAKDISVVASTSGGKGEPLNLSIIDDGEGQHPDDFPNTFLSLDGNNKLTIPYVQGQFSQGATGVHRFCGDHGTELIISRPAPDVTDGPRPWGFTIVRIFQPSEVDEGTTLPVVKYLTIDGEIPQFHADTFPLRPSDKKAPQPCRTEMDHGTFVKLYSYDAPTTTSLKFDPSDRLNARLPSPALPIRLYETRNYSGRENRQTLAGLTTRLTTDANAVVDGFPATFEITIGDSTCTGRVYALTQDANIKNYRPLAQDGILFTLNGQTHGSKHRDFFTRSQIELDYLKDSIIVVVSCDGLTNDHRADLFMSDRERLVEDSDVRDQLENKLEQQLAEHNGLQQLAERRQRQQLQAEEDDAINKAVQQLADDDTVSELLEYGDVSDRPTNSPPPTPQPDPDFGKKFPTRFDPKETELEVSCNETVSVRYDTDAENDYFDRRDRSGEVTLLYGNTVSDERMSLWNGTGTLTFDPTDHDDKPTPGEQRSYKVLIGDDKERPETPFASSLTVTFTEPTEDTMTTDDTRTGLALPGIEKVLKEDWEEKETEFTENTAVKVMWDKSKERYHFMINMANKYLENRVEEIVEDNVPPLQRKFAYGLLVLGLGHLTEAADRYGINDGGKIDSPGEAEGATPQEMVAERTKAEARILLPLVKTIDDLPEDEIVEVLA